MIIWWELAWGGYQKGERSVWEVWGALNQGRDLGAFWEVLSLRLRSESLEGIT